MAVMRPRVPALAVLFPLCISLGAAAAVAAESVHVWRAATDFREVAGRDWVPSYVETPGEDAATHGRAVRTNLYQGLAAAVEVTYEGPAGEFVLTLVAIAEEDGESRYAVEVDGRSLGEVFNTRQPEKRVPQRHAFPAVRLEPGSTIRVIFRGHSNGLIPEGEAYAWSRGRWRALEARPVR